MKPESDNKGPYDVPINIEWDAFLGVVAEKLMVVPSTLVVTSFEWHWLKPASSPWLPIQDENGFASMLKKVKTKSDPYIIVCMQAPIKKRRQRPQYLILRTSLPSIWKILTKFQRRYVFQVIAVGLLLNFHRQNWMTHSRRLSQNSPKSTLQDYVIITRIFPVFIIACQTCISTSIAHDCLSGHRPSNPERATYEKVPILSPMFKASLATQIRIKKMPKATDSDITAATNTPPVTQLSTFAQGQMPTMPFANFPQYPQVPFPQMYPQMPGPLPPFMGYAPSMPYPGNPFVAAGRAWFPCQ